MMDYGSKSVGCGTSGVLQETLFPPPTNGVIVKARGIGQTYPGSCGDAPGNTYFEPAILHNGTFVKTKDFCTDVFFGQAMDWIEARSEDSQPFFPYIRPNAPHSPYVCPEAYQKPYLDAGLAKPDAAYYGMITNIDDNMGRLTARLDEGVEVEKLTAHIDLFPTLAEIAGAKRPPSVRLDGRSLMPLLLDPKADWPNRCIFVHKGRWVRGKAAEAKYADCAVRNERFRLVKNKELYDIKHDPGETKNVIDKHPEVVARMRAAYDRWWDEVLPCVVNEDVFGPKINPFKERYWQQFGAGPTRRCSIRWTQSGRSEHVGRP
jgi:arylsulfatase A-like enzyme